MFPHPCTQQLWGNTSASEGRTHFQGPSLLFKMKCSKRWQERNKLQGRLCVSQQRPAKAPWPSCHSLRIWASTDLNMAELHQPSTDRLRLWGRLMGLDIALCYFVACGSELVWASSGAQRDSAPRRSLIGPKGCANIDVQTLSQSQPTWRMCSLSSLWHLLLTTPYFQGSCDNSFVTVTSPFCSEAQSRIIKRCTLGCSFHCF